MQPDLATTVSLRRLLVASAGAFVVAAVILIAIVLPAEYGMDPLRTGAHLGLLRGASTSDAEPLAALTVEAAMTPTQAGPMSAYRDRFRADQTVFELGPYEYVEYKYHLAQGAQVIYSWEATAPVMQDFHGLPDGGGTGAEISVDKGTTTKASGSLTAPFAGMHGWYWENPGGRPITIRVASAGFFSAAIEYRPNRIRRTHDVIPVTLSPPPTER